MFRSKYEEVATSLYDAEKILWTQLNEQDDAEKALSAEQAKTVRDLPRCLSNYEAATQRLVASMEMVAKLHSKLIVILNDYKVETFHASMVKRMQNTAVLAELEAYWQINIWSSLKKERLLFLIPTEARGKIWSRILLFVETVCGPLADNYALRDMAGNEVKPDLNTFISPGEYALEPVSGSPLLTIREKKYSIVPSGKVGNSSGSHSSPAVGSPRTETAAGAGEPSLAGVTGSKRHRSPARIRTSESNTRNTSFVKQVYQRDNHCVITKNCKDLEAAHILAHAWWNDSPDRRRALPENIIARVKCLANKIDDVRNGLLLSVDLAKAFDKGEFSLRMEGGHYRIVALDPTYENIDGLMLDENTRLRSDGRTWWAVARPDPELVAFHFRNSVLARVVANGSDDSSSDDSDNESCSTLHNSMFDNNGEETWQKSDKVKRACLASICSNTATQAAGLSSFPGRFRVYD